MNERKKLSDTENRTYGAQWLAEADWLGEYDRATPASARRCSTKVRFSVSDYVFLYFIQILSFFHSDAYFSFH